MVLCVRTIATSSNMLRASNNSSTDRSRDTKARDARERKEIGLFCSISLSLDAVLVRWATNSLPLVVAVEHNFTLILNKLAIVVALPERVERIAIIVSVMLTNERLEVLGGLLAVIEWHLREEVVDDVVVGDIVKEESPLPPEEGTVDGASGATLEAPLALAIMGEALVGVVELNRWGNIVKISDIAISNATHVSDHNEPVGHAEPRESVILDDLAGTPNSGGISDSPDHGEDAEVGGNDSITLRGVEKDRVGVEVVGPLGIRLLAGHVEEEVGGESEDLLADEHEQGVNRSVAQVMLQKGMNWISPGRPADKKKEHLYVPPNRSHRGCLLGCRGRSES